MLEDTGGLAASVQITVHSQRLPPLLVSSCTVSVGAARPVMQMRDEPQVVQESQRSRSRSATELGRGPGFHTAEQAETQPA